MMHVVVVCLMDSIPPIQSQKVLEIAAVDVVKAGLAEDCAQVVSTVSVHIIAKLGL